MTCILIGYFDRDTLFCSSRSLQQSVNEPTTFCTVQGNIIPIENSLPIAIVSMQDSISKTVMKRKYNRCVNSVLCSTFFSFCIGVFLYYSSMLQAIFWFCHVVAVFLTIKYPLTAQQFQNKGFFKYVHLGIVVFVLLLPWTTVGIVLGTEGYAISRFPTILCFARNVNVSFYAYVLPLSIIVATGMSLIVIIFWILIGLVQVHNESTVSEVHI